MSAKGLVYLGWPGMQISGGEGWFSSANFDIDATTDHPVTWAQMQLMFQTLLMDRFKLVVHRETKEGPVYFLSTGKKGITILLSPDQTPWTGDHPDEPGTTGATMDIRANSLTGDSIPIAMFINFLRGQLRRTVINRTGLTGRYAIDLHWAPDASHDPDSADPSFFTAIEEQLGLRLESAKAPVEMLIVDRAERPSANQFRSPGLILQTTSAVIFL